MVHYTITQHFSSFVDSFARFTYYLVLKHIQGLILPRISGQDFLITCDSPYDRDCRNSPGFYVSGTNEVNNSIS
jgi:hypothetical protein